MQILIVFTQYILEWDLISFYLGKYHQAMFFFSRLPTYHPTGTSCPESPPSFQSSPSSLCGTVWSYVGAPPTSPLPLGLHLLKHQIL